MKTGWRTRPQLTRVSSRCRPPHLPGTTTVSCVERWCGAGDGGAMAGRWRDDGGAMAGRAAGECCCWRGEACSPERRTAGLVLEAGAGCASGCVLPGVRPGCGATCGWRGEAASPPPSRARQRGSRIQQTRRGAAVRPAPLRAARASGATRARGPPRRRRRRGPEQNGGKRRGLMEKMAGKEEAASRGLEGDRSVGVGQGLIETAGK